MKASIILFVVLTCSLLTATTLTVKQDGTGDYSTIQSAIDDSNEGDVVLVYPGRYFENINYNGHGITVASLEYTTGDRAYVSSTIIDGGNYWRCVTVKNHEQNAVLRGLTLTNGQINTRLGAKDGRPVGICLRLRAQRANAAPAGYLP
jgi:hypothetical protein